jgi:hypothetical protein
MGEAVAVRTHCGGDLALESLSLVRVCLGCVHPRPVDSRYSRPALRLGEHIEAVDPPLYRPNREGQAHDLRVGDVGEQHARDRGVDHPIGTTWTLWDAEASPGGGEPHRQSPVPVWQCSLQQRVELRDGRALLFVDEQRQPAAPVVVTTHGVIKAWHIGPGAQPGCGVPQSGQLTIDKGSHNVSVKRPGDFGADLNSGIAHERRSKLRCGAHVQPFHPGRHTVPVMETPPVPLFIIRHAEQERIGQDGPLTARGREQATALAVAVSIGADDVLMSSPLAVFSG